MVSTSKAALFCGLQSNNNRFINVRSNPSIHAIRIATTCGKKIQRTRRQEKDESYKFCNSTAWSRAEFDNGQLIKG
jgi:hypothetical protein